MWLSHFSFPSLHPHIHGMFFTSIYVLCPTPTQTHTPACVHIYAQPYTHPFFPTPAALGRAGGGDGAPFQHLLYGPATFGLLPRTHLTPATLSFSCPKQIASALGQHWRFGVAWEVGPGPGAGVCRPAPHLAEAVPTQGGPGTGGVLTDRCPSPAPRGAALPSTGCCFGGWDYPGLQTLTTG